MARELPPANAGVKIDRGVVPGAAVGNAPASEVPPQANGASAPEAPQAPPEPPQGPSPRKARTGDPEATTAPRERIAVVSSSRRGRAGRAVAAGRPAMDAVERERWAWTLNASAGKLAAAEAAADKAENVWWRTVADARHAGIDENAIIAAAARVGIEVPEETPEGE